MLMNDGSFVEGKHSFVFDTLGQCAARKLLVTSKGGEPVIPGAEEVWVKAGCWPVLSV